MAVQLFRLRHVPEDEAADIRQLLDEHQIDFYETPAGNWGISMPALWLNNENQWDEAKALIQIYQQQREQNARQNAETRHLIIDWWLGLRHNPVQFIAYLILLGLIVYFSVMPFFGLSNSTH